MDSGRWERLQALFDEIVELTPTQRADALARLCPDDDVLRDEVAAMLAADDADPGFLEDSVAELAGLDGLELPVGASVGPYRIIRLLGEGGMGMVYEAERDDDHFQRRVALKVIKKGMDTRRVVKRFRAERQILASLAHPNVAHLFDGGLTDDGSPFFAMELVDGAPIDSYCIDNNIPLPRRLELMRDVCSAVQHAHQNLVVHRDLKPGNVLVTADGTVKLLDFGIAKLLDESGGTDLPATVEGPRPMTPDFASPEQIRGEPLTTAADIYSLGVLLHVLLTDRRPYDLTSVTSHELSAAVEALTPPRPSDSDVPWASRLRGDLDVIVQTAMHTDVARRYRSAEALAHDLERHAGGHPIAARRDSMGYRTSKFLRRNRVGVTVLAGVFIMTLAFAVAMGRQAHLISHQSQEIATERDRAEEITGLLVDMFDISNPYGEHEASGDTMMVRDFLQLSGDHMLEELDDQPELRATMAHLLGHLSGNMGQYERAHRLTSLGLELRRGLYAGDHPDIATSLDYLGTIHQQIGETDEAVGYFRESLAMRRRLYPSPHLLLAESLNNMSWVLDGTGDAEQIVGLDTEALAMRRTLLGDDHPDVAQSLNNLAVTFYFDGDFAAAEPMYREALAIRRRAFGPDHPYVANTINNLARLLRDTDRYAEADTLFAAAIDIWERALGIDHPRISAGHYNHALTAEQLGDLPRAITSMTRALDIDRTSLPAGHLYIGGDALELGRLLLLADRAADAIDHLREALAIYEAQDQPSAEDVAQARDLLSRALAATEEGAS